MNVSNYIKSGRHSYAPENIVSTYTTYTLINLLSMILMSGIMFYTLEVTIINSILLLLAFCGVLITQQTKNFLVSTNLNIETVKEKMRYRAVRDDYLSFIVLICSCIQVYNLFG